MGTGERRAHERRAALAGPARLAAGAERAVPLRVRVWPAGGLSRYWQEAKIRDESLPAECPLCPAKGLDSRISSKNQAGLVPGGRPFFDAPLFMCPKSAHLVPKKCAHRRIDPAGGLASCAIQALPSPIFAAPSAPSSTPFSGRTPFLKPVSAAGQHRHVGPADAAGQHRHAGPADAARLASCPIRAQLSPKTCARWRTAGRELIHGYSFFVRRPGPGCKTIAQLRRRGLFAGLTLPFRKKLRDGGIACRFRNFFRNRFPHTRGGEPPMLSGQHRHASPADAARPASSRRPSRCRPASIVTQAQPGRPASIVT